MKNYTIDVLPETKGKPVRYRILASTPTDARVIAFALDGGFALGDTIIDEGKIELVKCYTKVVKYS